MRDRVVSIMAAVFNIQESDISDSSMIGITKNWDSLKHMNLVLALEDDFGVSISDEDAVEMMTLPLILNILSEKCSNKNG